MDRLAAMAMFVRVVETGSFSAVAREMNSTQPTVSKNIAELESWLGAKLLNRTTRSLRLTETGADYYERCVGILQDIEEAETTVGQLQTLPKGTVRISAPVAFGRLHIVPTLHRFFEQYPDIRVELRLNDRALDLVEEGVELGIRMGQLADSAQIARRLSQSRLIAAASPAYLKSAGIPNHPRDLKNHEILIDTNQPRQNELAFVDGDQERIVVRVDGRMLSSNTEALRAGLLAGLGIAQVPVWLVGDSLQDGSLVSLLDDYSPGVSEIHALYPPGRHLPSRVRCLMDFLAAEFADNPRIDA